MPKRKAARLRELRTAEAHLQHCNERDKALSAGLEHMRQVVDSGAPPEVVLKQLRQAIFEADTALQVAQRHHELRMQELQTITHFPDEPAT